MKVKRALLSVWDKTGLIELARGLASLGVELISTGGTAQLLKEHGLRPIDISDFTGTPELMQGRVKTLHPKVHGGLLFLRGNAEHETERRAHGIEPIDLVVVNLYPFEAVSQKSNVSWEECLCQIDIGGPAMLRSAAKNHASVTVLSDPVDYSTILSELQQYGETSLETRKRLAAKAFQQTSYYDSIIARYLNQANQEEFPNYVTHSMRKSFSLRYGENPHQQAALYGSFSDCFKQLHGKELSYNNLLDLSAAVQLITEFEQKPTVAILKHNNPCGVGEAQTLARAWEKAFATDRQAPFGGVIIVNRRLDFEVAQSISEIFSEVIVAPEFDPEALALLQKKKNLRLLIVKFPVQTPRHEWRSIICGMLAQTMDTKESSTNNWQVVTHRQPSDLEQQALEFGWRVVKYVKSNAIVYCLADRTLGIGAGQMSRVDASKIAIWKANEANLSLQGSVIASDAFFPFADGVVAAAKAGATAVIQPGGSVRDAEVIAACNDYDLAMVFTGVRHFRH